MSSTGDIEANKQRREKLRDKIKKRKQGLQSFNAADNVTPNEAPQNFISSAIVSEPKDGQTTEEEKISKKDEKKILEKLSVMTFPSDLTAIHKSVNEVLTAISLESFEKSVKRLEEQDLLRTDSLTKDAASTLTILSIDQAKISSITGSSPAPVETDSKDLKRKNEEPSSQMLWMQRYATNPNLFLPGPPFHIPNRQMTSEQVLATFQLTPAIWLGSHLSPTSRGAMEIEPVAFPVNDASVPPSKVQVTKVKTKGGEDSIESLLSSTTFKEQESKEMGQELFDLLTVPTVKEQSLAEKFKSREGSVREFCSRGTREECSKVKPSCDKLHFRRIIKGHTDESLGDCSFLNTCFHMDTCKYVHYEVENSPTVVEKAVASPAKKVERSDSKVTMLPPQWIQCDIRFLDKSVLGKFAVIMADPPWDIHMELPYGTMQDDEMRKLDIPSIQDDGFLFLWVTGRAMELGRECLRVWGYQQVEELIWVKTNQLQRLIRTGRTGHWLNHGKEHCLVGIKGNPEGYNKGLDADVIVAEVRQTSHKPDEIYGLIERLSPGTRKIEFFGRMHNVQPNWVTLGNQLDGVHLVEPELIKNFKEKYPDMNALKPSSKGNH